MSYTEDMLWAFIGKVAIGLLMFVAVIALIWGVASMACTC